MIKNEINQLKAKTNAKSFRNPFYCNMYYILRVCNMYYILRVMQMLL